MRIHALRLAAADPQAVGAFYEDLGLAVVDAADADAAADAADADTADGVVVCIGRTDVTITPASGDEEPFYHFAITVPANRFDAAYEWLDDRVGVLADVETGQTRFEFGALLDATACYFRDPAGNIGELIARHSLDNAVPEDEAFGPQHLLAVSEIGIVVDDVPTTVDTLVARTGEPDLGGGDDFRMVGDDHGTFIVVDEDRPWFVAGDTPGVFPTDVVATVDADYAFPDYPYTIRVA